MLNQWNRGLSAAAALALSLTLALPDSAADSSPPAARMC